nr:unnamed protein product [Callosobruchus chinensis]
MDRVHFMVGSLYVKHLGRIEPLISDCSEAIIPIGFVCTRLFWSTSEPWKLVPYTISTSVQHSNNSSITVNRNFTIDHTLEKTALEKVIREFQLWQKDVDKKSLDSDSEDDEEQQNGADILSPELTDAILEELPHDLLDGISVQDIFPKLSCDELVNIDFKNEIQSSDGFFDLEEILQPDLELQIGQLSDASHKEKKDDKCT